MIPYGVIETQISNGQSFSAPIDLQEYKCFAIQMPAAWTAANITMQAAVTIDGTYQDVVDDVGVELTITAAASKCIAIDLNILKVAALQFIKFRSGTSATPISQAANRTIQLICKK